MPQSVLVIVDCALYRDGERQGGRLALDEVAATCHRKDAFVWIGLYEPTEEEFETVRREFDLHELAVEDAIAAVPTMVAGVYGMNFKHMPELSSSFGYPLVVAIMLVACFSLYRAFRRSGWL